MGLDRDVYWKSEKRPTVAEIRMVCEDFLGGAGSVEQDKHCTTVTLPGRCSHPLQRMPGAPTYLGGVFDDPAEGGGTEKRERWIEVWAREDCLTITTRQVDDFTNGLAERLADVFARWWSGTRREPLFPVVAVQPLRTETTDAFQLFNDGTEEGRCEFGPIKHKVFPDSPRGKALRDLRVSLNLSLGAAARALGIGVVDFSALERGGMTFADEVHWEAAGDLLRKAAQNGAGGA